MAESLRSTDGRLLAVQQDDVNDHGVKQFALYDTATQPHTVLFDRYTWEAQRQKPNPQVPETDGSVPQPEPPQSPPVVPPAGGGVRLIRVTFDGGYVNRMQGYWSNAHVDPTHITVFAGHADGRPRFFRVERASGSVEAMPWWLPYSGTTEGWSYDAQGSIYLIDGPRLRHVNPATGDDRVVFDISETHPGHVLWQAHSSDDGQTHSASVQRVVADGKYPTFGTVVYRRGRQEPFEAKGLADEAQIDPTGEWLIIKETPAGAKAVNNRIIHLASRQTQTLTNAQGAVGHSDCGPGILVGEWSPQDSDEHGACVAWDLRGPLVPERRRVLFETWNLGHLSIRAGQCLLSDTTHMSLVALDGSGITPLREHGMRGDPLNYEYQVSANLSPCGRVATFVSNTAGSMDVYLLVLP